jgi:hypothetical protein
MARSKWKKSHRGQTLRSGFEVKVAQHLDKKKVDYDYETLKLSYEVPASTHTYKPDFRLLDNGIIVEAKGRFSPADRRKMALVIEQHPDKDIRLLFMLNNTLSKVSKTTYTDWCDKRGIICAVSKTGEIPESWLKEKGDLNDE